MKAGSLSPLATPIPSRAVEEEQLSRRKNARCILLHSTDAGLNVRELYARVDELQRARTERMAKLLDRGHFRTSDDTLTRALNWACLSLDALMVEGKAPFAVTGVRHAVDDQHAGDADGGL